MESQFESHMNPNAVKWELSYLRVKCRELGIEECFELYNIRLNISNCALLMLLLMLITILEANVIIFTMSTYRSTYHTVFTISMGLLVDLFLLSLNFKNVVLTERKTNIRFLVNTLVAIVWILKDIFVMLINGKHLQAMLMRIDCFVLILLIYLFFPFNNIREMFFIAMLASTVDFLTHYNYLKLYTENRKLKNFHMVWEIIFKFYVHFLCISFRIIRESAIRVSILNRRQFIEEELYFNLINEREKLIMNSMLPAEIGHSLQEDLRDRIRSHNLETPLRTLYVEPHSEVSILNADIVKFTRLATSIKVGVLVRILHDIFVKFDSAAEAHTVLRIKFLGDCYNCVAGIPYPISIHANCCVDLGLEMIKIVQEIGSKYNQEINIRVGVHSGQVLSGVIGINKWNFDVWSKDVDIAIRLEQKGLPGVVHISQDTFNLLEGNDYVCQENTDNTGINSILQTHNINSYYISELKNPEIGYRSLNQVTIEPSILSYGSPEDLMEDCNYDVSDVKKISSSKLCESVVKMPIAQTGFARIFDLSRKPIGVISEDFEFNSFLTQVWLLLDDGEEMLFNNEPCLVFKYAIILVTILGYIIIVQSSRNATFDENILYFIFPIILMTAFCIIIIYKKLWIMCVAKTVWDQPINPFSSILYKISQILEVSFTARIFEYLFYMVCLTIICFSQLINCEKDIYELEAIEAELYDLQPPIRCFEPEIFTTSIIYTLIGCFLIPSIPFFIKCITSAIISIIYFAIILFPFDLIFKRHGSTFTTFHSSYSHVLYVVSTLLVLYVKERMITYIDKLNYLVTKDIILTQRKTKVSKKSVKILMQNILPAHIAEKYFILNRHGSELFSEDISKVAIMFASIKNYDPDKSSIRVLNDIICCFDDLLNTYKGHIEKIKVSNWSYMAACGLGSNYDQRDSRGSGKSAVRFSTKIEDNEFEQVIFLSKILNRSKKHYIKDNDSVVLLLTSFGMDLLRIMKEIIEHNIFLNLERDKPITLQIGISHGPVMAGVVGNPRPHYDVWGTPVNMASRMDSTGIPGIIQISETTARVLRGYNIRCDYRDIIFCKGFGKLPTYLVACDDDGNFIDEEYDISENTSTSDTSFLYSV